MLVLLACASKAFPLNLAFPLVSSTLHLLVKVRCTFCLYTVSFNSFFITKAKEIS